MYRPWVNRRVGIEMELRASTVHNTALSEAQLRTALTGRTSRLNPTPAGWYHSAGVTWDIKTDASCGWEVASPAITLDEAGHNEELKAVCEGLKTVEPRVDRACGLHVHIEVRDFTWADVQKLVSLWGRFEPFFFEMLPPSRRNNHYCQPIYRETWEVTPEVEARADALNVALHSPVEPGDRARHTLYSQRFQSLNLTNWWRHRRVEFRLHSGTIDYEKIRQWTMLLLAVVQRVKQGAMMGEVSTIRIWNVPALRHTQGFDTRYVAKMLGLVRSQSVPEVPAESGALVEWVEQRRQRFGPARVSPVERERLREQIDRTIETARPYVTMASVIRAGLARGLSDAEIVEQVRQQLPGRRRATPRDIARYRNEEAAR